MKAAIFLAEGFETCEGLITIDVLRRGKVQIDTYSINESKDVKSSQNVVIQADDVLSNCHPEEYDVLILPGGKLGTKNLEENNQIKTMMKNHYEAGKLTCAICAAPSILGHLGILEGRHYTCFPDFDDASYNGTYEMELAVQDGNVITGRGMGATIEFARLILENLISEEEMKNVEWGMQYEHSFKELAKDRI